MSAAWFSGGRKAAGRERYRPKIEELEDRRLMAAPLLVTGADFGGGPQVNVYNFQGIKSFSFYAYNKNFRGGVRVAVADVTGDGIPDVITAPGPGGGPDVRVFDGANLRNASPTNDIVREFMAYSPLFPGGVFVAAADFNRDGFADIITGADAGGGPHVKVFSGFDLHVMASFYAYNKNFTGGVRVAAGTVFGPGTIPALVTAAGTGGQPQINVYSGVNGALISSFFAFSPQFLGGVYVAVGDVNADGFADIIAGAGAGGGPVVTVFSGLTGAVLSTFNAFSPTFTGGVRVASTDFNGDGFADVVCGAGPGGVPQVLVFDGFSGAVIGNFLAYVQAWNGGLFVGAG
jgi:FG-GAP repeat